MDVRVQVSAVFHLDKCIGCHTCSLACKNLWTDRQGAEYMWWNNVETKPGTGYPTLWQDQEKYRGGWELSRDKLRLKLGGWASKAVSFRRSRFGELITRPFRRSMELADIFFNPRLPSLDDYYHPWSYRYGDLFTAPPGGDQPTARAISTITQRPMEIEAGPNWDDDLSGSPIYAANDPQLERLTEAERQQLFDVERIAFFYLPRICNHCLNPGCLAACPAGAIYKRGEDGIVLVSQDLCRGWRMCVTGCPYKKVYYNWHTGKSEKCIFCYPRQEVGEAPACFHSCVGRIRYLGVVLYDADRIEEAAKAPDEQLVEAQRSLILDPFDPEVIAEAKRADIRDIMIEAAQRSPVYSFVKLWKLALPLHPEFRTLPMVFYVPPLLPVTSSSRDGHQRLAEGLFTSLDSARIPVRYLAGLFSAGNEAEVTLALRKMMAVRLYERSKTVGDVSAEEAARALEATEMSPEEAEAIYHLTSLPELSEMFAVPPISREMAIEQTEDPLTHRGATDTGYNRPAERRY